MAMSDLLKPTKPAKVKKTVEQLLGEGQLKTGKTVLDDAVKKAQEHERFRLAAQEEERVCVRKKVIGTGAKNGCGPQKAKSLY
jgi:hypothetical protein